MIIIMIVLSLAGVIGSTLAKKQRQYDITICVNGTCVIKKDCLYASINKEPQIAIYCHKKNMFQRCNNRDIEKYCVNFLPNIKKS